MTKVIELTDSEMVEMLLIMREKRHTVALAEYISRIRPEEVTRNLLVCPSALSK